MRTLLNVLRRLYDDRPTAVSALAAGVVLAVDYMTGRYIQFPILYAVPSGLAAWKQNKRTAVLLSVLLPVVRFFFHYPWREGLSFSNAMVNAVIRILALLLYSYLIYRLSWQTKALETKVDVLEGILPICSYCKKIRNERGAYEPVEQYISEHSQALFSHGICPDCARRNYPGLFKDGR